MSISPCHILTKPSDFPNLPANLPLVIDVETTSFDDDVKPLNPFQGCRISGVAFCPLKHEDKGWYLPLRHRGDDVASGDVKNCSFETGQKFLQKLIGSGRDIINHNIKFDARFWHFDDCQNRGKLLDTLTLARLVDNSLPAYTLAALTGSKTDVVKAYMKSIRSKDWGRAPVDLTAKYAVNDVIITADLYRKLISNLQPETRAVWDVEQRLTEQLVRAEIHGVKIDVTRIKRSYLKCLHRLLELEQEIHQLSETEFDPNSDKQITEVLMGRLGIEPKLYTPKGRPRWDAMSLNEMDHPICKKIALYRHIVHFSSTYCDGWLSRADESGYVHPKFNQSGTRTGRLSSSDPNFQNVPGEAEVFVLPEKDHAIVGFDYSQIEYRIFGHYSQDEKILKMYNESKNTDFHQGLADVLGIERTFAKTLNFAFLYGMGKKKLLQFIAGICAVKASEGSLSSKMQSIALGAGKELAQRTAVLDTSAFAELAATIHRDYHVKFPSIRQLSRKVQDVVAARGWLRNYCGRVYKMDAIHAHRALNYLIQGSAADVFKQRITAVMEAFPEVHLITNVHDSVFFDVPREGLADFFDTCRKILTDVETPEFSPPIRVPILVDGKVSIKNWGTCIKCKDGLDTERACEKSLEARNYALHPLLRDANIAHKSDIKFESLIAEDEE